MKGYTWHKFVYRTIRLILMPFLFFYFQFRFSKAPKLNQPTIVLSNHTTDWDPMFLSMSFPQHLYFVASEHMFRWGFLSRLIVFLVAPIARAKATSDARTVKQILRSLEAGANVCIFAEGNRSFNGETTPIPSSIAKLAKQSGAALLTYRIEGGYFTQPRWGTSLRRGRIYGHPVNLYEPKALAELSDGDLLATIRSDLYENAYERQEQAPVAYNGQQLAEHLETVLYLCPKCLGLATLKSSEDLLQCSCGLTLRYTPYGYLESLNQEPSPHTTILHWDYWQTHALKQYVEQALATDPESPLAKDGEQRLYLVSRKQSAVLLVEGTLSLFGDRLVLTRDPRLQSQEDGLTIPLATINAMAVHGQMDLVFSTTDGRYFELSSGLPRSATKYIELFNILTAKE